MNENIATVIERIEVLQDELEEEFERRRARFRYHVERGRVTFERDVRRRHREIRERLVAYVAGARPLVVLTAPVIYAAIFPLVLLDLFVSLYQAICFPVYGIEKARRRDFITFDHQHLSYLNALEKLNCLYCSYANGLLAYAREIAARTEQHWCPIKHARRVAGQHPYYPRFVDYGDADGYQQLKEAARATTQQ